jgi:hypothetical protein
MQIQIDEQFRTEIDPLTREERVALECSILEYGCRDALVVWGDTLVDGHNRYEICTEYDVPYRIMHMDFESRDHALLWINNNQDARRNQTQAQRIDRHLRKKEILERIGRAMMATANIGNSNARKHETSLSMLDKPVLEESEVEEVIPHNTRNQIAESAGVSTGTLARAEVARRDAPEVWKLAKDDKASVNEAYKAAKLEPEEQAEVVRQVQSGESKTVSDAISSIKRSNLQERVNANLANDMGESRPTIKLMPAQEWLDVVEPYDLLLTDPPYSTDVDDINAFVQSWLPKALAKLKSTGRAYIFIGAYPEEIAAYLSCAMPTQMMVWTYRNTLGPQPKHDYIRNYQAILYYRMPDAPPLDCPLIMEQISVHDHNHPARSMERLHSWQKPMELAEKFVRHSTRPGDLVVDPFACTGTHILAAAKLGRIGAGCEIDASNMSIAVERGCYDAN